MDDSYLEDAHDPICGLVPLSHDRSDLLGCLARVRTRRCSALQQLCTRTVAAEHTQRLMVSTAILLLTVGLYCSAQCHSRTLRISRAVSSAISCCSTWSKCSIMRWWLAIARLSRTTSDSPRPARLVCDERGAFLPPPPRRSNEYCCLSSTAQCILRAHSVYEAFVRTVPIDHSVRA